MNQKRHSELIHFLIDVVIAYLVSYVVLKVSTDYMWMPYEDFVAALIVAMFLVMGVLAAVGKYRHVK